MEKGVATSDLAVRGGDGDAWRSVGIEAKDVEVIIVATVTPDMLFPATACLVQDKIGREGRVGLRFIGGLLWISIRAAGGREAG